MRAEARERMGAEFDLRGFHKTVIRCQGPLPVLETCVDTWIRGQTPLSSDKGEDQGQASGAGRTGVMTSLLVIAASLVLMRGAGVR